ncbi:glycosyltransferase [Pseudoduganella sp. FT26W]|uniref:Glycosyltransferase n=1 Tax=Duganella aquatilis TaxID=2666082 RepID=A0A844D7A5_9BURK|nr:glycosyltransferase family 2 protein [Duganella aquatilis]MRW84532.1 glycosyltransferase [Duganella aquatilis]
MSLPLVSIVIPSYKAGHFETCLRSALGQSYPNLEILVSDNCPTEAIHDICKKYAPHVIYQRNSVIREQNVLTALFAAKGEFIKPLFDDDVLHPFCIERMVAAIQHEPEVELVFSASQVISIQNQPTETRRPFEASGSLEGRGMMRSMVLSMSNFIGEFSTIMFRRQRLWEIGNRLFHYHRHDCSLGLADMAAYFNLAGERKVFYVDEELSYFRHDMRLESNSNPASNPNLGYCFSDYVDLLVECADLGIVTPQELAAMQPRVDGAAARFSNVFPMFIRSQQRYHAMLATQQIGVAP